MRECFLVLYDHDGFASADLDAEPTYCWADPVHGDAEWEETIRMAGAPFYGVTQNTERRA